MTKKIPSDYWARRLKTVGWLLKEPRWTVGDRLKDIGITFLALVGSILIVGIAMLGIARGFGLV